MYRIALVTAPRLPDGMEDTASLSSHIRTVGMTPELVSWSDTTIPWDKYDCIMLHSPWDYSARVQHFMKWLSNFADDNRLLNSYSLISWNLDKRYLRHLQQAGVLIPPTIITDRGSEVCLPELADLAAGMPLVTKPVIGAGGRRTYLTSSPKETFELIHQKMPDEPVIIQRFEPVITSAGEYSAIYLGQSLSHVVKKKPGLGEFRVQSHFGGATERVEIEPWMTEYSASVLQELPCPPAYARVDFVVDESGSFKLMEVELAEPDLFLRYEPKSYTALTNAILKVCKLGLASSVLKRRSTS